MGWNQDGQTPQVAKNAPGFGTGMCHSFPSRQCPPRAALHLLRGAGDSPLGKRSQDELAEAAVCDTGSPCHSTLGCCVNSAVLICGLRGRWRSPLTAPGSGPRSWPPPMSLKEGGPGAGARVDTEIPQVTPQLVLEGHSTHGFMHVKIAEVNPPPRSASLSGARAYSADREALNGIKSC